MSTAATNTVTVTVTHEITPYGELKLYTTAPAGTHHSTIAAAALHYARSLAQPEYVSSITGAAPRVTKPGKWCTPTYSGEWRRVSSNLQHDTHTRKFFTAWPVPDYNAEG